MRANLNGKLTVSDDDGENEREPTMDELRAALGALMEGLSGDYSPSSSSSGTVESEFSWIVPGAPERIPKATTPKGEESPV